MLPENGRSVFELPEDDIVSHAGRVKWGKKGLQKYATNIRNTHPNLFDFISHHKEKLDEAGFDPRECFMQGSLMAYGLLARLAWKYQYQLPPDASSSETVAELSEGWRQRIQKQSDLLQDERLRIPDDINEFSNLFFRTDELYTQSPGFYQAGVVLLSNASQIPEERINQYQSMTSVTGLIEWTGNKEGIVDTREWDDIKPFLGGVAEVVLPLESTNAYQYAESIFNDLEE